MESFESALKTFDTDKDGKLSKPEYAIEKGIGEHFGWVDADDNGMVEKAEYDDARRWASASTGLAAVRPAGLTGKVDPNAAAWRFKKNLPFVPTPVVYDGVVYMVKAGGIVTAIDPATGRPSRKAAARTRPETTRRHRSPRTARCSWPASTARITVLKAGREWDVLGVNDLGDEIHATPALKRRTHLRPHARRALLLRDHGGVKEGDVFMPSGECPAAV